MQIYYNISLFPYTFIYVLYTFLVFGWSPTQYTVTAQPRNKFGDLGKQTYQDVQIVDLNITQCAN